MLTLQNGRLVLLSVLVAAAYANSTLKGLYRPTRDDSYYYSRYSSSYGGGAGSWDTRDGISSFNWDSQRDPVNTNTPCTRCGSSDANPGPGHYRGNGYDNLSPEWDVRRQKGGWDKDSGSDPGWKRDPYWGGSRGGTWSGSIRPIERPWDDRPQQQQPPSHWDNKGQQWNNRGSQWENRGSHWENKGTQWENSSNRPSSYDSHGWNRDEDRKVGTTGWDGRGYPPRRTWDDSNRFSGGVANWIGGPSRWDSSGGRDSYSTHHDHHGSSYDRPKGESYDPKYDTRKWGVPGPGWSSGRENYPPSSSGSWSSGPPEKNYGSWGGGHDRNSGSWGSGYDKGSGGWGGGYDKGYASGWDYGRPSYPATGWDKPRDPWDKPRDPWNKPRDPWDKPRDPWNKPRDPWDKPRDPWDKPRDPWDKPRDPWDKPKDPIDAQWNLNKPKDPAWNQGSGGWNTGSSWNERPQSSGGWSYGSHNKPYDPRWDNNRPVDHGHSHWDLKPPPYSWDYKTPGWSSQGSGPWKDKDDCIRRPGDPPHHHHQHESGGSGGYYPQSSHGSSGGGYPPSGWRSQSSRGDSQYGDDPRYDPYSRGGYPSGSEHESRRRPQYNGHSGVGADIDYPASYLYERTASNSTTQKQAHLEQQHHTVSVTASPTTSAP